MSAQTLKMKHICLLASIIAWPALGSAQVPVDDSGNPVAAYEPATVAGDEELTRQVVGHGDRGERRLRRRDFATHGRVYAGSIAER